MTRVRHTHHTPMTAHATPPPLQDIIAKKEEVDQLREAHAQLIERAIMSKRQIIAAGGTV